MKHLRCFAGPSAAALLVILAGLWHFFDTAAGASGSGDLWLTGAYWLLFAAAAPPLHCRRSRPFLPGSRRMSHFSILFPYKLTTRLLRFFLFILPFCELLH